MDVFVEYIVTHKRGKKEILIILVTLLAGAAISWFGTLPLLGYALAAGYGSKLDAGTAQILTSLAFALFVAVWYLAYRIIKNQHVEYEYSFTSGELDVDMITAKRKRKRLLNITVRSFSVFAHANSSSYNDFYRGLPTVRAVSDNCPENVFFAVYTKEGQKKCLLFEPPQRMLDAMKPFLSSGVMISE